jgi:hypothetical protein
MADRNDNKLAKDDKNDPRVDMRSGSIKENKISSGSEP